MQGMVRSEYQLAPDATGEQRNESVAAALLVFLRHGPVINITLVLTERQVQSRCALTVHCNKEWSLHSRGLAPNCRVGLWRVLLLIYCAVLSTTHAQRPIPNSISKISLDTFCANSTLTVNDYRSDIDAGQALGHALAEQVLKRALLPAE